MTDFFPILNQIEILLRENQELKRQLMNAMTLKKTVYQPPDHLKGLLRDLYECAMDNSKKKRRGWMYISPLKDMSVLFYILGGRQMFELLSSNLPLPSLSSVRSYLYCSEVILEGQFRWDELKQYLTDNNEALEVHMEEDGTRVLSKLQYDPGSNQIVGPVQPLDGNGCPVVGAFPATSAAVIAEYFGRGNVSSYAYTIMARPLGGSPPFCVALFGTDNKFSALDVCKRQEWMRKTAEQKGITIRSFSSDGDGRLLKVMRYKTLRPNPSSPWPWFQGDLRVPQTFFQDYVHLLVKLKSRLLAPSIILPIGPKFVASKGHLVELIHSVQKDRHELTISFLDNRDKMNFRSADKICALKVTELLRECVVESEGTATYLDFMRETFKAFADPSLSPQERVEMCWEWVFFCRLWRQWIVENEDYFLTHNFITTNAYYCLEINAHSLIQSLAMFRDSELPFLFKPHLCTSQDCEDEFRILRSMTSTFCTVINFSILEMVHRIRRADYLRSATFRLKDRYNFPRNQRAFEALKGVEYLCTSLPEDYELEQYMQNAFHRAMDRALALEVIVHPLRNLPKVCVPLLSDKDLYGESDVGEDVGEDDLDDVIQVEDQLPSAEEIDMDDEVEDDIDDDLIINSGPGGLRTFDHVTVTPDSPFVKVRNTEGGFSTIKKTTLCWLLSNGHSTLSNDRLIRVQDKDRPQSRSRSRPVQLPVKEDSVAVGTWCAFVAEDRSMMVGRLISFRFMSGSTAKNQQYAGLTAPVMSDSSKKVGCMCSWYSVCREGSHLFLRSVPMDSQGYYDLENYLCTIPRPRRLNSGKIELLCRLKDITDFGKGRLRR